MDITFSFAACLAGIFVAIGADSVVADQPDITITYYDLPGRAEPIRLAFTLGGIAFKDNRIQKQDWASLKPTTLFGQVPVMTVNGEKFAQSAALLRYAGRLSGLYPSDPIEAMKVDMVMDQLEDTGKSMKPAYIEKDPVKRKAMIADIIENDLPGPCSVLDKFISKQGGRFACGSSMTIADLLIYNKVLTFKTGSGNVFKFKSFNFC
jgi:glutathione S-transferase